MPSDSPIVVSYEDRAKAVTGVKLLALSLAEHCQGQAMDVTCPGLAERLNDWRFKPERLRVRDALGRVAAGWDVKPVKLLELLDEGWTDVVWVDADVLVTGDLMALFRGLDPEVLVVAANFDLQGMPGLAIRYGLTPGRRTPERMVNSGFVRVTPRHRRLLDRWMELLQTSDYLKAQAMPYHERPFHLRSDQEALEALLGSSDFEDVPIQYLKPGTDIIIGSGIGTYRFRERLGHLRRGFPSAVHAQGPTKPWEPELRQSFLGRIHSDLATYSLLARHYRNQLDEPTDWLKPQTGVGWSLRALSFGHPILTGMALSCAAECARQLRGRPRREIRPRSRPA